MIVTKSPEVRIKQEGDKVLFFNNGILLGEWPYRFALDVAKHLQCVAKLAEEYANADSIIEDQAILMRSGVPIGLSHNKDIHREALKEAQYSRCLRRNINGSKGTSRVGTPGVYHGKGE